MRLSRSTTYGLYGLCYIAGHHSSEFVPLAEVAEYCRVSKEQLAPIFRALVRAGLLTSSRGVRGGFALARSASRISPLDVIEAVEGRVDARACLIPRRNCSNPTNCRVNAIWLRARERMLLVLRRASIQQMARSTPRRFRPPERTR